MTDRDLLLPAPGPMQPARGRRATRAGADPGTASTPAAVAPGTSTDAAPSAPTSVLAGETVMSSHTGPTRRIALSRRPAGRAWLIAAAAAVVVIGSGAAVVVANTNVTVRTVPASAAGTAAVATWLATNVRDDATIASSDPTVRRSLATAGLDVTAIAAPDDLEGGSYLVDAPAGDADATRATALGAGRSLVPVARFDDGAATVRVAQVIDRTPAALAGADRAERDTAASASRGLLANPALTVAPPARPALEAGSLDLRAAAFLALLAADTPIRVVEVRTDAVERAAGLADRRVVVVAATATTLRRAAAGARIPFAPEITTTAGPGLPAGSVTLTWPLLVDATAVVS